VELLPNRQTLFEVLRSNRQIANQEIHRAEIRQDSRGSVVVVNAWLSSRLVR
jgi:hypothetical protein